MWTLDRRLIWFSILNSVTIPNLKTPITLFQSLFSFVLTVVKMTRRFWSIVTQHGKRTWVFLFFKCFRMVFIISNTWEINARSLSWKLFMRLVKSFRKKNQQRIRRIFLDWQNWPRVLWVSIFIRLISKRNRRIVKHWERFVLKSLRHMKIPGSWLTVMLFIIDVLLWWVSRSLVKLEEK